MSENDLAPFEADRPKFTVEDVARLTGWATVTVWRHAAELPHYRVGKHVRFSENQLRQILCQFEHKPVTAPPRAKRLAKPKFALDLAPILDVETPPPELPKAILGAYSEAHNEADEC